MRVVLDTNVLVYGLLWKGPSKKIVDAIEHGELELCLTPKILEEVKRVLNYPKIAKQLGAAGIASEEAIQWLLEHGTIFNDFDLIQLVVDDPSDDMFLNCAFVSGVGWIVSGDRHLRRIGSFQSIRIVGPGEFLENI